MKKVVSGTCGQWCSSEEREAVGSGGAAAREEVLQLASGCSGETRNDDDRQRTASALAGRWPPRPPLRLNGRSRPAVALLHMCWGQRSQARGRRQVSHRALLPSSGFSATGLPAGHSYSPGPCTPPSLLAAAGGTSLRPSRNDDDAVAPYPTRWSSLSLTHT
jgi:hypothetical protein